jgi:hypothetical protein
MLAAAGIKPALHPALAILPSQMIWAWERPEDLRWLPANVGVAYVALAIELEGERTRFYPRANPLYMRPDTSRVAVVHVDASWHIKPTLDAGQQAAIVDQVLQVAQRSRSQVVQLDFEVRRSQRPFLMAVVRSIRERLPRDTALSVTALASWCAGDYWLEQMPADEFVPMAFRMARDDRSIRAILEEHGSFPRARCRFAVGLATDEVIPHVSAPRRYYFSPLPWTLDTWQRVNEGKAL